MHLAWGGENELISTPAAGRFKQAELGERPEDVRRGALILLNSGTATCADGLPGPARKGTCLWLSRHDAAECVLSEDATGILSYIRLPRKELPASSRIIVATPLLYAVLERLTESGIAECPVRVCYENVALEEIRRDLDTFGAAQVPRSPQLQLWAIRFIEKPRVTISIEEAADSVRMSVRSFTRHFKRETGEDFRTWKKRALISKAKSMLDTGRTVSEVGSELAYESISSFIAMFKEATGRTPGSYARSTKVWPAPSARGAGCRLVLHANDERFLIP